MTVQKFLGIVSHSHWKQTSEMVQMLNEAGFWDDAEMARHALNDTKMRFVQRMVRSIKGKDGHRAFVNVQKTLSDGRTVSVYKQEMLFDVNDYRYAVGYNKARGMAYIIEANRLAKNCRRRGVDRQMAIPFPSFDGDPTK